MLVAGVSGGGKSSTVAAMVDHINRSLAKHIITIENPIEFLHRDINCSVTQREVGVDTEALAIGLRAALRQDPDVLVVGEVRDAETLDTVIKGAEMGYLVIAVISAPDAVSAIGRVLAMFPRDERQLGRLRLADALRAVIAQRLVMRKDDHGRVAAMDILVGTPAVRSSLRDPGRAAELPDLMAKGRDHHGMQTIHQHLAELQREGVISAETAKAAAEGVGAESDHPAKGPVGKKHK